MRILAIDTSTDETAAAVTQDTKILSNVIWSSASLHAKWGGVVPSLAQRAHEERIDWVVKKAMLNVKFQMSNVDYMAVTVGPGLAIALEVGIDEAKKLAKKFKKPLIAVNHVEGHLLSSIAKAKQDKIQNIKFPAYGLVVSGGTTMLVLVEKIGKYKILAETVDDALGEALDKAARALGLGYPGGAILEKFAKEGNPKAYTLPAPLISDKIKNRFSYSGLKTAFIRLLASIKNPSKQQIFDLAACFQNAAFEHVTRVLEYQARLPARQVSSHRSLITDHLLLGGGVAANVELRKRLRKLCLKSRLRLHVPYSKKLYGDNAAMIGVAAYFKAKREDFIDPDKIDREPRLKI